MDNLVNKKVKVSIDLNVEFILFKDVDIYLRQYFTLQSNTCLLITDIFISSHQKLVFFEPEYPAFLGTPGGEKQGRWCISLKEFETLKANEYLEILDD